MNNIALIELEQPLECSPTTSPICLPLKAQELKLGYNLSIAGWGTHAEFDYNDEFYTLREGEMVKVETSNCNNPEVSKIFHKQYVCAFGKKQSACQGDIGGSAFTRSGKSYYAVGIASHGNEPKFRPLQPITFTNVNHFAAWIRLFVRQLPQPWSN
ncbi:tryptase beta-2 [Trichonephila inaurata madagascariensis]|uniref:Tryptase beta-2 n=1 Tax=Trichonephila inaurata madagascariensis TaxID=2747483 RepID=A0A8X6MIL4_9ARAC|nr:tryptase beta-2 [Trichonephila inaurata madagascariensis]